MTNVTRAIHSLFYLLIFLVGCGTSQTATPLPTATRPSVMQQALPIPALKGIVAGKNWSDAKRQLESSGIAITEHATPDPFQAGFRLKDAEIFSSIGVILDGDNISALTYYMRTLGGLPIKEGIGAADWQIVDPKVLLTTYGSPSQVRASIRRTGLGLGGAALLYWDEPRVAVSFDIDMLDVPVVQAEWPLCILSTNVTHAFIWMTSGNLTEYVSSQYPAQIIRPFESGMFTNAATIDAVRGVLLHGECLRTRPQFWGYDPK